MFEIDESKEYDVFGKLVSKAQLDCLIAYLKATPSYDAYVMMQEKMQEVYLEHAVKPESIERFKKVLGC